MAEPVERKAPKSVRYSDVLPMALPSSSNRRLFLPTTGAEYAPDGNNIVRIDLASDSFLNPQNTYLQYELENSDATASSKLTPDPSPMSPFARQRIESGGVVLEDTHQIGRLYSLLQNNQVSTSNLMSEGSILGNYNEDFVTNAPAGTDLTVRNAPRFMSASNTVQRLGSGESKTICVPIVSALFSQQKLIPLFLLNAGVTVELTLNNAQSVGVASTDDGADPPVFTFVAPQWKVKNVRIVSEMVEMSNDFYDALRSEMMLTGSLSIHGHGYRHYSNTIPAGTSSPTLNIPARMKSIKSILSTFHAQANDTTTSQYSTSVFTRENITDYQYRIGSVNHPATAVQVGNDKLAPAFAELQKCFGKFATIDVGSNCSQHTYRQNESDDGGSGDPEREKRISTFAIGVTLDSFANESLESGIDSATFSLPITLSLTRTGGDQAYAVVNDNYVMYDLFIYINADGSASPSN